jgi:hypothetical protein
MGMSTIDMNRIGTTTSATNREIAVCARASDDRPRRRPHQHVINRGELK